ncbi:hypothetical protein HPB50_006587 [Hyalomma asiaticum]|uniref:Uncharacterized protein n=1 Tax=Hyalomma asiaticum TaxID=266040 RepID=A0ACB7SN84_HYAAI|nr:hypothetical protein HPB50_006587 [Hyalomma asiaticum]
MGRLHAFTKCRWHGFETPIAAPVGCRKGGVLRQPYSFSCNKLATKSQFPNVLRSFRLRALCGPLTTPPRFQWWNGRAELEAVRGPRNSRKTCSIGGRSFVTDGGKIRFQIKVSSEKEKDEMYFGLKILFFLFFMHTYLIFPFMTPEAGQNHASYSLYSKRGTNPFALAGNTYRMQMRHSSMRRERREQGASQERIVEEVGNAGECGRAFERDMFIVKFPGYAYF